jgi:predicted transposase YdaD
LVFRYQVLRVWQLSPQVLLQGGLALLPLAPISAVTEAELPGIIEQMERRLREPGAAKKRETVWAASFLLLGLRYSSTIAAQLFRGVLSMKESSTYQMILEEGRGEGAVAEAKKVLRLQGDETFGLPDRRTAKAIERISDLTHLEALLKRLPSVRSWQELLSLPEPPLKAQRRRAR